MAAGTMAGPSSHCRQSADKLVGRDAIVAYDPTNTFGKILRGELPRELLCEDEHAIAIMDAMPQSQGHCLIITREPAATIFEISPDGLAACIRMTQRVAIAVRRAFEAPGLLIAQTNGSAAGQSVPHLHIHVIPRQSGEVLRAHAAVPADRVQLHADARRIRQYLDLNP
jgi:histidine triad (HIT) family protein